MRRSPFELKRESEKRISDADLLRAYREVFAENYTLTYEKIFSDTDTQDFGYVLQQLKDRCKPAVISFDEMNRLRDLVHPDND